VGRLGRRFFSITYNHSHWEETGKELGRLGRVCTYYGISFPVLPSPSQSFPVAKAKWEEKTTEITTTYAVFPVFPLFFRFFGTFSRF